MGWEKFSKPKDSMYGKLMYVKVNLYGTCRQIYHALSASEIFDSLFHPDPACMIVIPS